MAICEKTGLEFEASSKRQKNHPAIMNKLNEAHRNGWYKEAMEAIERGRKQDLDTIEAFLALMEEGHQANSDMVTTRIREEREFKEAQQQARMERREQNDFLNAHSYRWRKWVPDEEDADLYGAQVEWYLTAPDGRVVSLKQAMLELAFTGLAYAKEWLKTRGIAEELPEIEKERQAKAAQRMQEEQEIATLNAERAQYFQEAKTALLDAGLSEEKATHQALLWSQPHTNIMIELGPVVSSVMLAFNSDLRYGAMVDGVWYGLDEIEEMYPDIKELPMFLAPYKEKNNAAA